MSKNLKDFIDANRRAFDDEVPPAASWSHIEKNIRGRGKTIQVPVRKLWNWSVAAAVLVLAAVSVYLLFMQPRKQTKTDPAIAAEKQHPVQSDISDIAPEYAAEANRIARSIEQKQERLKVIARDQPALYHEFANDLRALDSSYRVLKNQAMQAPNREIILRAMMQNLQLQAELLGKQLEIIHELNQPKNEKDPYRPAVLVDDRPGYRATTEIRRNHPRKTSVC